MSANQGLTGLFLAADASTVAPAAQLVNGEYVLTDAVLANLTALSLTDISLFQFAGNSTSSSGNATSQCKTYPGDVDYPSTSTWSVLDLLTGNALISDVPLSSVCYQDWGNYDAETCAYITEQWANTSIHLPSPSDLMFPLWQGTTCLPPNITTNEPTGNCTLGGFPNYIVCPIYIPWEENQLDIISYLGPVHTNGMCIR